MKYLTLLIIPFWLSSASANTLFTFVDSGSGDSAQGNNVLEFTPTQDLRLTALGYYNAAFREAHPVGVFDTVAHVELSGALVTATDTLSDSFRWVEVAPIILRSGQSYLLAGYNSGNYANGVGDKDAVISMANVFVNPLIISTGYFYNYNTSLGVENLRPYASAYFGPNIRASASAVPIPPALWLLSTALCVLALPKRNKK